MGHESILIYFTSRLAKPILFVQKLIFDHLLILFNFSLQRVLVHDNFVICAIALDIWSLTVSYLSMLIFLRASIFSKSNNKYLKILF